VAIAFTGTEGLFTRIGRLLHVAYLTTPYAASLPAAFASINAQYETTFLSIGGAISVQANALTRVSSGVMAFASQAAQNTVIQMVRADQPSQSRSLQAALLEVVRQMILQGVTVEANVIAIIPTQLTGSVGNGVLVTTTRRGDGLVQENSIQETLRLVCTQDAYTGTATAGRELFALAGSPDVTNSVWDYDWPTGSAASVQANAISSTQDASTSGNFLTNGDFEDWSSAVTPVLSNFTLSVGTWGTDIQRNSTNQNTGTYCVQFNPGATNTVLYQEFGNATTGTSVSPAGLTPYCVNLWLRKVSGTISAGVLTVELVDGSGVVTQDEQGVNNSFTVTLSTLTTSYVAYSGNFRLSNTPPDTVRLQFRISTDLAGAQFVMDDVCFAAPTLMYTGGPYFRVFSGATQFVAGDGWNLSLTNNYGGASNLGTFQTGFARLLSTPQLGILLPSATPGTVSNALISA